MAKALNIPQSWLSEIIRGRGWLPVAERLEWRKESRRQAFQPEAMGRVKPRRMWRQAFEAPNA